MFYFSEETMSFSTLDPEEIKKFSDLAAKWWDPDGTFRVLHRFNPVRLAWIKQHACARLERDPLSFKPFSDLRLLDVGCGGGLLSEPMARLGASVVGVDASEKNIKTAHIHAQEQGLSIDYRSIPAEALLHTGETFDIVLAMEVIEHVQNPMFFVQTCAKLLAPSGILFVATLNRTLRSFLFAIVGAEYILGWLPRGTHHWEKFITPCELEEWFQSCDLSVKGNSGVVFNPLTQNWSLSQDTGVNYMFVAQKNALQNQ